MKLHLPRVCLVGLASGVCAAAFAQSDIPIEYLKPLNNSFSFGLRTTGHGVKVKFGNLGTIGPANLDAPAGFNKTYDDGAVNQDALRANEIVTISTTDPTTGLVTVSPSTTPPTQVPLVNGRYRTTSSATRTNPDGSATDPFPTYTGDYLGYQAGQTREWAYTNGSQATEVPGSITMHSYSSTSDGASVTGEGGSTGGIELEMGHTFGRIGNHLEWGFTLSFGLNDINVKSSATIHSTLHTLTDVYSLQGATAPGAPYSAIGVADATDFTNVFQDTNDPTNDPVLLTDTTTTPPTTSPAITTGGQENTTPLAQEPTSRTETDVKGGATIIGHWQIKGAYYITKFGPSLRYNFTPKIAVSTSFGMAIAYIGTKYNVDETLILPGLTTTSQFQPLAVSERKLSLGAFGNLNAEYWVTPRTGFYGGVTYEKLGSYSQVLAGRTANIDIGSGIGYRFGITTKF